jgi:hypothetical protein
MESFVQVSEPLPKGFKQTSPSESLTITRALAELKLLDTKINQKTHSGEFVFMISKKNRSNYNLQTLISNSQATYQSITDLITRRNKLKSAIILSNSNTKVS